MNYILVTSVTLAGNVLGKYTHKVMKQYDNDFNALEWCLSHYPEMTDMINKWSKQILRSSGNPNLDSHTTPFILLTDEQKKIVGLRLLESLIILKQSNKINLYDFNSALNHMGLDSRIVSVIDTLYSVRIDKVMYLLAAADNNSDFVNEAGSLFYMVLKNLIVNKLIFYSINYI